MHGAISPPRVTRRPQHAAALRPLPRWAMGRRGRSLIVRRHPVTGWANERSSSKTIPEVQRMTKSSIAAARALEIWQFMQDELVRVIAPLSAAQLNARIAPNQRTVGELAEHIVR